MLEVAHVETLIWKVCTNQEIIYSTSERKIPLTKSIDKPHPWLFVKLVGSDISFAFSRNSASACDFRGEKLGQADSDLRMKHHTHTHRCNVINKCGNINLGASTCGGWKSRHLISMRQFQCMSTSAMCSNESQEVKEAIVAILNETDFEQRVTRASSLRRLNASENKLLAAHFAMIKEGRNA